MVPQTFTYSMRPIRDAEGIAHPQRDWASSAAGMPHPAAAAPTASQESLSITGPLFGPFCGFEVRSMFEFFLWVQLRLPAAPTHVCMVHTCVAFPLLACAPISVNVPEQVQLVLEFCDLGSLQSQLDGGAFLLGPAATADTAAATPNYLAVLEVASDVARGMLHLHNLDILHCDLKVSGLAGSAQGPSEHSSHCCKSPMHANKTHETATSFWRSF